MLLNYFAIIVIVAYYINCNRARQMKFLALRQLKGEHSGINIAQVVFNVVGEYKIKSQIGYFVLDNASNNNITVNLILRTFYP